MKKITFLLMTLIAFSWQSNAQFSFPTAGPVITLDDTTPVTVSLNDVANAAGVPSGTYYSYTVTCDWINLDNAWSNEERLSIVTSTGATTSIAPSNGAGNTNPVTGLTFSGNFGFYDPDTNGLLELSLTRSYNSDAQLSNIVVTITGVSGPQGLSCTSGNSSFIFTENFESDPPSGWTGTAFSGNNGDWDITTSNSNSGQTGPSSAFDNGSGMHLEYEASGNSSATASAISPAIDLTSAVEAAELSFYLHAYGIAMGTLNVGVSNSASGPFTTVFTQNGQLQTADSDPWVQVGVNLDAYVGQIIYIEYSNTGSGSSYQGDMSIDNIRVEACDPVACTPPTTQASADAATGINPVTGNATINWTAGADGDNILVVMREGSPVDLDPTIGVSYTANATFGTPAAELGTANYIVYDGSKATESVNVNGLNQGTTYHFALYQYDAASFCYNTSENIGNFFVPCGTPDDVIALSANPGNEQIDLSWTNSSCFDEVLVIAKSGSAVTATPVGDGSAYTANSFFGLGTEITTNEFIVYKSSGTNITTENLTNGTTYHFEVFTRIGSTWSSGVVINSIPNLTYCTVVGDLTYATAITLVDFGSISNVTGQDLDDGYSDFTNISTTVTKGGSEDLTVNLNTDGNYLVYSYAWIDWNQDGDFDDSGEAYDLGSSLNTPDGPTSISPLTISIPTNAAIGNTRMRIVCQYNAPPPAAVETLEPCLDSTDGEFEDYTINVTGSVTYTFNNGWSENPNGVATANDDIVIAAGNASIDANTTCSTTVINPGASLTIDSGFTLSSNDLTLESNSTSYSSLMVDGAFLGNANYNRHVNIQNGGNDLISAPVSGQTFGAFAAANSNIFANPSNPSQKLFGPWSKITNEYLIYDTDVPADANTIIDAGTGYRTASSDNGTFTFTGTVNTGTIAKDIVYQGPHETEWNLVGNPYPSYLNVQDFLNHDLGGGVTNIQLFNTGTAAVYGYDGNVTDGWVIYNLATTTASTVIAPGQGFFVSADPTKVAAYDLEFTPAMQTMGTGDDFISGRSAELTYFKLNLSNNDSVSHTDFYFNTNSSRGYDHGHDAVVWGGNTPEFSVYSRLVEDDAGDAIALQALNTSDVSNVMIPLGVNTGQGEQITFSIAESTLSDDINIYLEDTETNLSILLNTNDYVLTPNVALSGTGRFFLRFSEEALSITEDSFENIEIYTTKSPRALFVKGQLSTDTNINIYDIQGRLISNEILDHGSTNHQIDLFNVVSGIYLVNLDNGLQQYAVKVIID